MSNCLYCLSVVEDGDLYCDGKCQDKYEMEVRGELEEDNDDSYRTSPTPNTNNGVSQ